MKEKDKDYAKNVTAIASNVFYKIYPLIVQNALKDIIENR